MIAMNGPTPTADVGPRRLPGRTVPNSMAAGHERLSLPAFGPIAPERPALDGIGHGQDRHWPRFPMPKSGKSGAAAAFAAFDGLDADAVVRSWKRMNGSRSGRREPYIAAGSFTRRRRGEKAGRDARRLWQDRDRGDRDRRRDLVRRQPARRRPRPRSTTCSRRRGRMARRTRSPSATEPTRLPCQRRLNTFAISAASG